MSPRLPPAPPCSYNDDGWLIGRSQWDAPDVDPLVFLTDSEDPAVPRLEVGGGGGAGVVAR